MPVSRTYRCLNCLEDTVTRSYDVSHLTRRCGACGEFDRHVNQRVLDQYDAFEADPPDALDWESLERTQKLLIAERIARHGRSVESFAPDPDEDDATEESDAESALPGDDADTSDERSPDVTAGTDAEPTEGTADDDTDDDTDDDPVVDPDADVAAGTTDEPDPPDSTPSGSD